MGPFDESPLWVRSEHGRPYGNKRGAGLWREAPSEKRTFYRSRGMSAKCQKRTFRHSFDYFGGSALSRCTFRNIHAVRIGVRTAVTMTDAATCTVAMGAMAA